VPLVPLVPAPIEPLVPDVPLVPLVPLSVVPIEPVPAAPLALPELPLEPVAPLLLEPFWPDLLFFCFFLLVVSLLEVCPLACEPELPEPLVCALALNDIVIAAATEAPSIAFNNLCIFMSIS
jgi:hypothetical protein